MSPLRSVSQSQESEPSYRCFQTFGRRISKIAFTCKKVAQLSLVIGLIAGLAIVFSPAMALAMPVKTFPTYTARFMYNDLQLVSNGTAACGVETRLETESSCETAVKTALARDWMPDFLSRGEQDMSIAFREKGIPYAEIGRQDQTFKRMHFGLNKQKYLNYLQALRHIEFTLLSEQVPYQDSENKTVATIKELHLTLTKNLPEDQKTTPGQFRTEWLMIDSAEQPELSLLGAESLKKRLTTSERATFKESFAKFQAAEGNFEVLTEEELRIWNKLIYIPPGPKEVEREMREFAKELKKQAQDTSDAVELASFLHMEIARISPFGDANGRLARILMNTELKRGGIDPVIIDSDDEYSKVVDKSIRTKNYNHFTNYLREQIAWTNQQQEALGTEPRRSERLKKQIDVNQL